MEQTEEEPKKIKVQKRTPTEKQLESLEKARLSKQKKKIIQEIQNENSNSFLVPPPYLTGLILLGFAGLGAYSFLKAQKNSPTTVQNSDQIPIQMETLKQMAAQMAVPTTPPAPTTPAATPRMKEFFSGSTKL